MRYTNPRLLYYFTILCSKNSNERLAVPAVAGLLVTFDATAQQRKREGILWEITAIGITTIGPI